MTRNRLVYHATVLLLAARLHAQQPTPQPVPPAAAPGAPLATTPAVQTVPNALQAVDTETLGPIENAGTLRIRAGSGTVVTMQSSITRVAVGDEKLLAVHVLEPREILLQGLQSGRSTLFVWLTDRRRLRYDVIVVPKIDVLRTSLRDVDPGIEAELSADGSAIVLRGDVPSERAAKEAERVTQTVLGGEAGVRIVNLLRFPPATNEIDQSLTAALESVDPRIRVRKIMVRGSAEGTASADTIVLEGRVKNISALVRAITLADLQMGGSGAKIEPINKDDDQGGRRGGSGASGGMGGAAGGFLGGGGGIPGGTLPTHISRGLALRSGRVISFLEVDELPQIQVAIRALQVDRGRARELGIDYRIDAKHVSIGTVNNPRGNLLAGARAAVGGGSNANLSGVGNILASFVDNTVAIAAAIDLLEQKSIARSVAEPNITTLSGEEASVLVGGSIPIPSTTVGQVTAVQGFSFHQFGIRLDIRPTLNPNGVVALELSPSIMKPNEALSVGGVPGFEVQTVSTNAKVAPGQSLIIGGLLTFDDSNARRGVPGLSSIPVIRNLFSWDSKASAEKEIIFVITPRVLSEPAPESFDDPVAANVEPLPHGRSPVLPVFNTKEESTFTPKPPQPRRPNGLPPEFPLQPIVSPGPDASQPMSSGTPAVVVPSAPAAETNAPVATTAQADTSVDPATGRPAPQAPSKSELPPPPSPSNP